MLKYVLNPWRVVVCDVASVLLSAAAEVCAEGSAGG